jgi:phosphoglycolate phosphatase
MAGFTLQSPRSAPRPTAAFSLAASFCYNAVAMKLVIFDCDGTLVDSQQAIFGTMQHAFGALGLPTPGRMQVLGVIGLSLPEAFAILAPAETPAAQAELVAAYRSAFSLTRMNGAQHNDPLFPGMREVVTVLAGRDDIVLGVATGKSRRGVARLLEREGWHGHFLTIQTADDHPSKPHPSMIFKAMVDAGVGPEATVMVGDTTFDIEMARSARVGAVGVAWGYHKTEQLVRAGAHVVAETGDVLVATIDTQFVAQAQEKSHEHNG